MRAVPVEPTDPVAEGRRATGEQPAHAPEGGVVKILHWTNLEVVPGLVELEVAVPHLTPAVR
jgi:hypothetical protein